MSEGCGGTTNPCTVCAPLGAALASAGVRGAMPLLHGAQGCATYIRRYLISHFREPMDVASSSFGEAQTVFGGSENLCRALDNVVEQYRPELIAVATTCLAETIGEDIPLNLRRWAEGREKAPLLVSASTPSYKDGHVEGFHAMVHALVRGLAVDTGERLPNINILPPPVSPADLRHLREMVEGFAVGATILPDYADRLDGVILDRYRPMPDGGTPVDAIAAMPRSLATLDFTLTGRAPRASSLLAERGSPPQILGLPIGVRATDALRDALVQHTGHEAPAWMEAERGRLLDAYADGHKVLFGVRVGLYGDPELVCALAGFLSEIGARPVLCATGARNHAMKTGLADLPPGTVEELLEDTDFQTIEAACKRLKPDLLMGSSKGYRMARALGVPLLRVGFPIHDRLGAGRVLHVGYRGTARLFDELANTILARKQEESPIGFSYL
jgi:nitrogenase molybdenum-iron protein NifN